MGRGKGQRGLRNDKPIKPVLENDNIVEETNEAEWEVVNTGEDKMMEEKEEMEEEEKLLEKKDDTYTCHTNYITKQGTL